MPELVSNRNQVVRLDLLWREDDPPNHLNAEVDQDQYVVNKALSLYALTCRSD